MQPNRRIRQLLHEQQRHLEDARMTVDDLLSADVRSVDFKDRAVETEVLYVRLLQNLTSSE